MASEREIAFAQYWEGKEGRKLTADVVRSAYFAGWSDRPTPALHASEIDGGRFEEWTLEDFAAQCRMQSREQLDPEFSRFMAALAKRLSELTPSPQPREVGE